MRTTTHHTARPRATITAYDLCPFLTGNTDYQIDAPNDVLICQIEQLEGGTCAGLVLLFRGTALRLSRDNPGTALYTKLYFLPLPESSGK